MQVDAGSEEGEVRGAAVFDVCDTLYFSNTTHDFVKFVLEREGGRRKAAHAIMNSPYSPFKYFFIGLSIFAGWDYLKKFNVRLLKGKTKDELNILAASFVDKVLNNRRVACSHRILNECLSRGNQVVLCSSSIEPVVAAVASDLGVKDHVSTRLAYKGGKFTGRIDKGVTEKLSELRNSGHEYEIGLAVSDNPGDLELLRTARKRFAIAHTKRKREFWKRSQIDVLDPDS
jgi:phosphoserine phosphatase